MGVSSAWRGDALNDLLSKPAFAPVQAKKRAPRPSKYSEEAEAASDSAGLVPTMLHGLKSAHAKKAAAAAGPAPWDPAKSPVLRQYGYTMTSHDLQPGMTVTQWPGASSHTIGSMENMTKDVMLLKHTDGTEAIVGRNASFAQGVPQQ